MRVTSVLCRPSNDCFCFFCSWTIHIGDRNLANLTLKQSPNSNLRGFDLSINKTFVHPNYNGKSAYFDIAVIQTDYVPFSKNIQPICLPESPGLDPDAYDGRAAELLGKVLVGVGSKPPLTSKDNGKMLEHILVYLTRHF